MMEQTLERDSVLLLLLLKARKKDTNDLKSF